MPIEMEEQDLGVLLKRQAARRMRRIGRLATAKIGQEDCSWAKSVQGKEGEDDETSRLIS